MQIEFTVDMKTGAVSQHTTGVKGSKCKPISDAVKKDMLSLGADVVEITDTPEMNEVETINQTAKLRLRS